MFNFINGDYSNMIDSILSSYIDYLRDRDESLRDLADNDPIITEKCAKFLDVMKDLDDAKNMIYLGESFRLGNGMNKDIDMAISCYKVAAEMGESFGYECIAQIYLTHERFGNEVEKAYSFLAKAEESGHLSTMGYYLMGNIHYLGLLGEKDIKKAEKYFSDAVDTGCIADDYYWKAKYRLGQIYEIISKDLKAAALEESERTYISEDEIEEELKQ